MKFCTYLTIYRGNRLPPFYIGYSSISKIESGYRGSVSSKCYREIWNHEIKNNPTLFSTKILKTFDNMISAKSHEFKLQKHLNVHTNPLYVNMRIHGDSVHWIPHSEKTKRKMSISRMGSNNPFYGKTHTEYSKKLIGEKSKQKIPPRKGKSLSVEIKLKISNTLKGRKLPAFTEERKRNMSEAAKRRWKNHTIKH
jgi:hypothetical protein